MSNRKEVLVEAYKALREKELVASDPLEIAVVRMLREDDTLSEEQVVICDWFLAGELHLGGLRFSTDQRVALRDMDEPLYYLIMEHMPIIDAELLKRHKDGAFEDFEDVVKTPSDTLLDMLSEGDEPPTQAGGKVPSATIDHSIMPIS